MPPKEEPLTYGGSVVGYVLVTGLDGLWFLGRFRPGPAYQTVAAHLEHERALSERRDASDLEWDTLLDDWNNALEAINKLGLRLGNAHLRDFKVARDGRCEFKHDNPNDSVAG